MGAEQKRSNLNRPREGRWVSWNLLFIFIALTIGIGASGYFYYKSQEKQLRDATNDQLSAVADLKVKQIVAWRDDRIEDATIILKQSSFVPFIHQWLENPAASNLEEKVSAWMNIFQEDKNYKAIFLADAQGNTRISLPQRDKQASLCIQPYFAEAVRSKKIIFADFHFEATTHQIHLACIIPLFDASGNNTAPFGFVVLEIDPYQFLYPLIQIWPTPSKTAETLLVRREGNEVVFLNELRHRKNTALTLRFQISRHDLPAVMAVKGKTGIVEGVDYRGKPVVATLRAVPGSPWYLVAKVDYDEIDTRIKNQTRLMWIVFSLLFFLSGTLMLFLWRHQRSQFYKKQYETERKLASERRRAEEAMRESEKKYRALIETTNTGYVILDLTGKVLDANDEYARLTGHERRDEILGRSLLEWTAAYDRERNAKAVEECVRQGFIRNLEIDYVGPQGQTISIEGNGTLVSTSNGTHILTLCRDITARKRGEENLQRIQMAVESGIDAIGMLTPQGLHFYHNQAFTDLFGYSIEELNKPLGSTIVYADAMIAREVFETIMQGNSWRGEIMMVAKSGRQFPVALTATAIKNDKDKIIGLIGIHTDITERKHAEEKLKASEARYRQLIETMNEGMAATDKDFRLTFMNERFCTMLEYPREELMGHPISEFIHEDFQQVLENQRARRKKGEAAPYEMAWKKKGGETLYTLVSPRALFDDQGNYLGSIGVLTDITERKEAEKTLQRSEEEAQRLAHENGIIAEIGRIISLTLNMEEVYDRFAEKVHKLISFDRIGINVINPHDQSTTIAYVSGHDIPGRRNKDHYPLAGSLSGEVARTRSSLLFQADDEKEWAERFPASLGLFRTGIRSKISIPLMSHDQVISVFHLESLKSSAYTDVDLRVAERVGNQIAGAIANAQLFAQHERSEAEKANLQAQLQQSQKMEAIGQLAGGVAHDFNNLLTVISIQSQLSLLGLQEGDPLRDNLQEIEKAADRAANLTRQLLAFGRRQILEMKVLNLNFIVSDLEKMLNRVIGEDIELKTILADDLGMIKVDPGQMEQVIINLAVNAKDAMPQGGKLTLETANVELDEKYAGSHIAVIPGLYVMLAISDTGVGMSKEVCDQIFDPFFTTKEKGKGTGLGLSTVYGIVKQSRGNIWVYSEAGHGTTFKIYLPQVFATADELTKEKTREEVPRGEETIMVVEDDGMVRQLAIDILRRQGYRVLEATEGGEALVMCEKEKGPIDLILTDIVMPHMSGPELIERLKQVRKNFKVFYMTGYAENAIIHQGIVDKGVNLIHKPFTFEKLASKVREIIDGT